MAARAGGAPVWGTQALLGRVGSGRGRGWAAAPSLLRPALSRSSTLWPRPLHSPPPSSSSSSSSRLLFHLPAARAAGTSSARRRRRRKHWQQRLRHPIWRKRVGPRSSEIGGASQRAPWRLDRGARRPRGNHRASAGQSVAARRLRSSRPGPPAPRPPPRSRPTRERALQPGRASVEATAERCAKKTTKRSYKATSLGKNFVHVFVVSMRIGPFIQAVGFSCSLELSRKVA